MFWKKKKKEEEPFKCSECGEVHSGWPALAFSSPVYYHELSQEDKESIAKINSDFCIIDREDGTHRFIRVALVQPVNDSEEDLEYGLWVSLSEESFNDYWDNYENENHETQYFGWLSSMIPQYDSTLSIPTTVVTQKGNKRPYIFPHKDHDHPFVKDFNNGISSHEAQRRVDEMMGKLSE